MKTLSNLLHSHEAEYVIRNNAMAKALCDELPASRLSGFTSEDFWRRVAIMSTQVLVAEKIPTEQYISKSTTGTVFNSRPKKSREEPTGDTK